MCLHSEPVSLMLMLHCLLCVGGGFHATDHGGNISIGVSGAVAAALGISGSAGISINTHAIGHDIVHGIEDVGHDIVHGIHDIGCFLHIFC